jgi:hypothetical protein
MFLRVQIGVPCNAMEAGIEKLVAILLFATGVSHIAQPRAWAEFFISIRGKGRTGIFFVALMNLSLGALVIAFHNVSHGLAIVVTLLGYGWTIKGLIYFVCPTCGLRAMAHISLERAWIFVVGGCLSLALSAVAAYCALQR